MKTTKLKKKNNTAQSNDSLLPLLQYNSTKVDNVFYIDYYAFVQAHNISEHPNGLARRKGRYPTHFLELHGRAFLSEIYARALLKFHTASKELDALNTSLSPQKDTI